jgi:hypothetical protein
MKNYNVDTGNIRNHDMMVTVEKKEVHYTESTHSTSSKPQEKNTSNAPINI